MLDGTTLMPGPIRFNTPADNDQQFLQFIKLPEGSFLTFDKGYNNCKQFATFTENKIYFITRQKDNAFYKTKSEKIVTGATPDAVFKEETIEQNYKDAEDETKLLQLHRIAWWDAKKSRVRNSPSIILGWFTSCC